ncbi:MAG: carboxynorspermidine decarboxylase, partial [bacterium]
TRLVEAAAAAVTALTGEDGILERLGEVQRHIRDLEKLDPSIRERTASLETATLELEDLETTLAAIDKKFGHLLGLPQITYLNMGGGHWITQPFYDRQRLIRLVKETRERYGVEVWLEPGEAVAIHTGVLRATVMDVFETGGHRHAILSISATAHMPDVLEMPYRPQIVGAGKPGEHARTYRLGGMTCLAGDVIGDYSFPEPLKIGDKVVFLDMAHYTMVKNNTFNGVGLPSIALYHPKSGEIEVVRRFGYEDYRNRLS